MEKSILIITALLSAFVGIAQDDVREFEMKKGDSSIVMKRYAFCLYVSGENRSHSEEEAEKIQAAHMNHISSMAEEKGLIMAGPLEGESAKRGVLIFDVNALEEAEAAISQDPAVKAGRLGFECHSWWAAKGVCLE